MAIHFKNKAFGEALRLFREKNGLTPDEMAIRASVHFYAVQKAERGHALGLATGIRLACAAELDLMDFVEIPQGEAIQIPLFLRVDR